MFFYELAMHLYGTALSVRTLYRTKKFSSLKRLWCPSIPDVKKPVIWVHAVSLGEVKAMQAIVERLHQRYQIVVSSITDTGYKEAQKLYPYAIVFILPLDISYVIQPVVKKLSPQLVLLSETDYWPRFLQSVPGKVCVINGKISERSYKRWKTFSFFAKWIQKKIDHIGMQDQMYVDRFLSLGFNKEKITLTGNIKIDQLPPALHLEQKRQKKKEWGCENSFVITLGSTHSPEEKLLIQALSPLPDNFRCFIVPRHPQRFDSVERLLKNAQLSFSRFSEKKFDTPWILVDQMGILTQLYQISDLAFVGGTLTKKVGGHNLLEPLSCDVPTFHGPFLHSQPTLATLLKKYQASYTLELKKIDEQIKNLINSPSLQKELQANGKQLLASSHGALEKNWQIVLSFLQEKKQGDRL